MLGQTNKPLVIKEINNLPLSQIKEMLLLEIVNYAREDSQLVMVIHSQILLGIPSAEILSFDDKKVHSISYKETDSYQITKMFIENKDALKEELDNSTVAKIATVQTEGNREIEYYNLDIIISVGYRVKSQRGIEFRRWANKILKE